MKNIILSGAIGDALGVTFEMMEEYRRKAIVGLWDRKCFLGSEYHKILPGNYSDDSQVTCCVAESLIQNGFDPDDLANRYVNWLTSGNARGYGTTTLHAVENLSSGMSYKDSGIKGTLGTGAAMRSAPFGVFFKDIPHLVEAVTIDAKITHNSDESIAGALAVALMVFHNLHSSEDNLLNVYKLLPKSEVKERFFSLIYAKGIDANVYLEKFGASCDVREAVPTAIALALDNSKTYIEKVLLLAEYKQKSDTDTILSMAFQIMAAKSNIPFDEYHIKNVENSEYLQNLDKKVNEVSI